MRFDSRIVYSLIIPHRNTFQLLKKALESIPDRNDIQIIIVDNSTENIDINFLKIKNHCIVEIVFSDTEKGAGHARNKGMERAKGKWLLFLDADDFFNQGAFTCFDKYIDSEYDVVYFSANSVFLDTRESAKRHLDVMNLIDNYLEDNDKYEDKLRYCYVWPVNKLIRHDFVIENAIFFDEVPAANDMMFSVKTGHFAKNICADNFQTYCVTVSKNSLTRTISKKNQRSRFKVAISQYQFMNSIGRKDQRIRLMSEVVKSLRFGFREFLWYIKTSREEKVNIFLGANNWPIVIAKHFLKKKDTNHNYYTLVK